MPHDLPDPRKGGTRTHPITISIPGEVTRIKTINVPITWDKERECWTVSNLVTQKLEKIKAEEALKYLPND